MIPFIKSNNSLKKLKNTYYVALLPLFIYGLYKYYSLLNQFNLINFLAIIHPLILILIPIIISLIIEIIYQKYYLKQKIDLTNSLTILNALIVTMLLPIKTNYFVLSIVLFLSLSIIKILKLENKINVRLILFIIIFLALNLFNFNNYNFYQDNLKYSFIDLFIGRSRGGIFSTSNLWLIVSYLILCSTPIYKREIPFYFNLFYLSLLSIYTIIFNNYDLWLLYLNGFILFSSIFILPYSYTSPNYKKEINIYTFIIAILTFILTLCFKIYYAIFLAILLTNILVRLFKFITSKENT